LSVDAFSLSKYALSGTEGYATSSVGLEPMKSLGKDQR